MSRSEYAHLHDSVERKPPDDREPSDRISWKAQLAARYQAHPLLRNVRVAGGTAVSALVAAARFRVDVAGTLVVALRVVVRLGAVPLERLTIVVLALVVLPSLSRLALSDAGVVFFSAALRVIAVSCLLVAREAGRCFEAVAILLRGFSGNTDFNGERGSVRELCERGDSTLTLGCVVVLAVGMSLLFCVGASLGRFF